MIDPSSGPHKIPIDSRVELIKSFDKILALCLVRYLSVVTTIAGNFCLRRVFVLMAGIYYFFTV
jgi:hypothetical protein